MKCLMILLILSSLLIGLGLTPGIFSYQGFVEQPADSSNPAAALSIASGAGIAFVVLDGFFFFALLCAEILLVFHIFITAVLAVISVLRIRQEAPDKQRKGKRTALAALILNIIVIAGLLILDLHITILKLIPFFPWGLLSISLCLTGGALLVFGIFTYKKLQIPTAESANVVPEA